MFCGRFSSVCPFLGFVLFLLEGSCSSPFPCADGDRNSLKQGYRAGHRFLLCLGQLLKRSVSPKPGQSQRTFLVHKMNKELILSITLRGEQGVCVSLPHNLSQPQGHLLPFLLPALTFLMSAPWSQEGESDWCSNISSLTPYLHFYSRKFH